MNEIVTNLYNLVGYDPAIPITNLSDLIPILFKVGLGVGLILFMFKLISNIIRDIFRGFRLR